MSTATSIDKVFDRWFGKELSDEQKEKIINKYGFILKVVVSKNIPPRHSVFSWIRAMGVTKFDELFGNDLRDVPRKWLLGFPERFCSLQEQSKLINTFVDGKKNKNWQLEELCILTQSAFIVSDSMQECVSIISLPESELLKQDYML